MAMRKKSLLFIVPVLLCSLSYGQSSIAIAPKITMPKDSVAFIKSLNDFLDSFNKPTGANPFVNPLYATETAALIAEMNGMENSTTTKHAYQCYLTNVSPIDSVSCLVQLSYLSTGSQPAVLRASFKLLGQKQGEGYVFSSPLRRNTLAWKAKKTGNFMVYSNTGVEIPLLNRYIKMAGQFDEKLKAPKYLTEIFYGDNFNDMMSLLGEDYKLDYNGLNNINNSWTGKDYSLTLIGATKDNLTAFDLHDLWHSRLHQVVSVSTINRPIDEACAYLYGGSWGIYTWTDILNNFKTYMGADHNWLKAFDDHRKFAGIKTPLYTDYVINALIAQKIEKELGFAKVIEFVSCGKKETDNANYFRALEKLTGIARSNFNERIEQLVATAK